MKFLAVTFVALTVYSASALGMSDKQQEATMKLALRAAAKAEAHEKVIKQLVERLRMQDRRIKELEERVKDLEKKSNLSEIDDPQNEAIESWTGRWKVLVNNECTSRLEINLPKRIIKIFGASGLVRRPSIIRISVEGSNHQDTVVFLDDGTHFTFKKKDNKLELYIQGIRAGIMVQIEENKGFRLLDTQNSNK